MAVVRPVKEGAYDHRFWHVWGTVSLVGRPLGVIEVVGENRFIPVHLAVNSPGVGVQKQLGRVTPLALLRIPRAVDPEPVALAWPYIGQVTVPAEAEDLGQVQAGSVAFIIEET
jgi:hypothetical protein